MNFEFLVEDISGQKMLEILIPKIIDTSIHSYRIIAYKGIGSFPTGLKTSQDASKRALLNQLPKLLSGYGKTYQYCQKDNVVIIVCDLDNKDRNEFLTEFNTILHNCNPAPQASLCLAIEEGEAWLLGDWNAIKNAYPKAKEQIFKTYINDSICGTWEKLADIIYPGGREALIKDKFYTKGIAKTEWATAIAPKMNINNNKSPSFNEFKETLISYSNI